MQNVGESGVGVVFVIGGWVRLNTMQYVIRIGVGRGCCDRWIDVIFFSNSDVLLVSNPRPPGWLD